MMKRPHKSYLLLWSELWFSKLICQSIIKVWSTFSKVVGVGKAHKYFPFMQSDDSRTALLFGGLNTTALAFKNAIATRKEIRYFINKIYFFNGCRLF